MFSPLEEIKNKLDIVEVIGQYVKLQKAGSSYKALCPFHKEKTPSFFVSPSRQIFHCFGCGAGGDIFTFIMKIENVDFNEAVKILADKAGVKLTYENPQLRSQKQKLLEIHKLATDYFHQNLLHNKEALEYLIKRGISKKTIEEFQLGFALDDWRSLVNYLISRGYSASEILASGLAISKQEVISLKETRKLTSQDIYDRFRSRIMFPIINKRGEVVAFTGRIFTGSQKLKTIKDIEAVGKYINSPQTLIYDKSKILFGYYQSHLQLSKNPPIIVEGPMDFLAGWQAGLHSLVATCGIALTSYHLSLLKRFNKEIILGFDMDEAGLKAAERAIDLALSQELEAKILRLPQGKDLADFLLESEHRNEIQKIVSQAQPVMEFYFERALQQGDLNSLSGKKQIVSYFLPQVKKFKNALDRSYWLEKLSQKLKIETTVLEDELHKLSLENLPTFNQRPDENESLIEPLNISTLSKEEILAERILAICSQKLELKELLNQYKPFFSQEYQQVIEVLQKIKSTQEISPQSLTQMNLTEQLQNKINLLTLRADYEFDLLNKYEIDWRQEVESNLKELKKNAIKKKLNQLSQEIKEAETKEDRQNLEKLLKEFNDLSKELAAL